MKALLHFPTLLRRSFQEWNEDHASTLAAGLAYYTIFSLAPLLVLVIALTGLVWQKSAVQAQIMSQMRALVGPQGASFIGDMISHRGTFGQGIFASVVGIIALLFGALGVFGALQTSLNIIWNVQPKKTHGFWQGIEQVIAQRLLSFAVILGIGFLLLVSLVISAGLSAFQGALSHVLPFSQIAIQLINLLISIAVITVLFALMFKLLPDVKIAWRDVWFGALATAILFALGKTLIGIYLGNSNVASYYGAAGSLVVLLLWIYYSAQILFFGAELTQVYANQYGTKIVEEVGGETVPTRAVRARLPRPGSARRPTEPRAVPVTGDYVNTEKQNRQLARVLGGTIIATYVAGLLTYGFAFRRRKSPKE